MNPRAYDQLNVPTEVEAYIPVQKLFLCCCCRRVSGSLRKARDRDPYTKSNTKSIHPCYIYCWPCRGSLGLGLPAVVLWDNHRSIGPVEGQVELLSLGLTSS